MKILIADDDPVWRRMIEAMLGELGDEVIALGDGLQAWHALQAQPRPALAILDWVMPGMDGIEICRRVRESKEDPYVYILLLTVKDKKAELAEGFAAGADDYISKPFDPQELKGRLMAARRVIGVQTALLEAQRELRIRASLDSLTGLWNRGAILELLDRELARGVRERQPVGVLLGDVDYFKRINDTHGHDAGDRVLQEIVQRVGTVVRSYDYVGRYGGEEIVFVLPGCDAPTALATADRVRASIERQPFRYGEASLAVTMSVGVASTSQGPEAAAGPLLRSADAALYRAKAAGRNRSELGLPEAPGEGPDDLPTPRV
jgi:two-component system, cell cycle response regulator